MMELYKKEEAFRRYVDAYCIKHGITPQAAVSHVIVRAVGEQIMKRKAEIDDPVETEIRVGCGGC